MTLNKIIRTYLSTPPLWGDWEGLLLLLLLLLSGCVTDPIYNTDHPDEAKITIVTAWNDIGSGVSKPSSYIVETDGIKEEATTDKVTLSNLFNPGYYEFLLYNHAEAITVEAGIATVRTVTTPAGKTGTYIEPVPGWLFSGTIAASFEADRDYQLSAPMHQQVRQLTLIIKPEGSARDKITAITASLSGVASGWELTKNEPSGEAAYVVPVFTRQADGNWSAVIRLLGISSTTQLISGAVTVEGSPAAISFEGNISNGLADFNKDKKNPLSLNTIITVESDTETEAGFTATIKDWEKGESGSGVAN